MIEYDTLISEKFIPKDKEFQDFVIKDSESVVSTLPLFHTLSHFRPRDSQRAPSQP